MEGGRNYGVAPSEIEMPAGMNGMRALCDNRDADKLPLPMLKKWSTCQGLTPSGKRSDLLVLHSLRHLNRQ